ncbi:MAG: hypothetical protein ACR2LX_05725 [Jatrophihabitans sp.]
MNRTIAVSASVLGGAALSLTGCSSSGTKHSVPSTPSSQTCPSAAKVSKAIATKVETEKRTPSATSVVCGYNYGKTIAIASVTFGLKKGDLAGIARGLGLQRKVTPLPGIGDEAVQIAPTAKDTLIVVVRFGDRAVTVDMDEAHDTLAVEMAFAKLFA